MWYIVFMMLLGKCIFLGLMGVLVMQGIFAVFIRRRDKRRRIIEQVKQRLR